MILEFGNGKIGVCTVVYDGKENVLLIEDGKGTGVIGECPPDRIKNTELDLDELSDNGAIVMQFENESSVQVVMDALELIKRDLILNESTGYKVRKGVKIAKTILNFEGEKYELK